MPLAPGTRLGPYEIAATVGTCGMGVGGAGTQSTHQNRRFAASVYRPDDQPAKPIRQALLYVRRGDYRGDGRDRTAARCDDRAPRWRLRRAICDRRLADGQRGKGRIFPDHCSAPAPRRDDHARAPDAGGVQALAAHCACPTGRPAARRGPSRAPRRWIGMTRSAGARLGFACRLPLVVRRRGGRRADGQRESAKCENHDSMPITIFDSDTIPRDRRAELEAAVVAAGRHLSKVFEGWIVATPDRRRFAVRITSISGGGYFRALRLERDRGRCD